MKVQAVIVNFACAAVLALEAWNLNAVVQLTAEVAALKATVSTLAVNKNFADRKP